MNILLINPGKDDIIRAHNIVKKYKEERLEEHHPRTKAVFYSSEADYSDVVAVWHSANQITLHFGFNKDDS